MSKGNRNAEALAHYRALEARLSAIIGELVNAGGREAIERDAYARVRDVMRAIREAPEVGIDPMGIMDDCLR